MGAVDAMFGPDLQSLASKVIWTFIQTAGSVVVANEAGVFDASLLQSAAAAGIAAALVPVTVYARGKATDLRPTVYNSPYQPPEDTTRYND